MNELMYLCAFARATQWGSLVAHTDAPSLALLKDMYKKPVVLEAHPVPVLVISGRGDQVTTQADVQATLGFHGIDSEDRDAVKWLPDTADHLFVMRDQQARSEMTAHLAEWMHVHF
jgi:alpha-beta hydrolase superfamily lysophospholipase